MLPSPSKGLNSLPIDGKNSPIFPTDYMIKRSTIFTLKAIISCYEAMVSLTVHCCLLLIILIEMANSFVNVQKKSIFSLKSLKLNLIRLISLPNMTVVFSIMLRLLLLRSGDIEQNPGPRTKPLSFGCWNVDSLLARQGINKDYLESIQSINNFDIFGICETYLNPETNPKDLVVGGFSPTPLRADYKGPSTRTRGGVCLYYKESTPIKHRPDLELIEETIVAEIKLNRKSIIYILSYRSPSQSTTEFSQYMQNLNKIYSKASTEKPSMIIINGDFNARSPLLWKEEQKHTPEGKGMADFCTENFLHHIHKHQYHRG